MTWDDDPAHGTWRLLIDRGIAAFVVHHSDGWRAYVNPGGEEVVGAPWATLVEAQQAAETALGLASLRTEKGDVR